jgi:hypothetical protein
MKMIAISESPRRVRRWFLGLLATMKVADPPPSQRPLPFSETENGKLFAQIAESQRRDGKIP